MVTRCSFRTFSCLMLLVYFCVPTTVCVSLSDKMQEFEGLVAIAIECYYHIISKNKLYTKKHSNRIPTNSNCKSDACELFFHKILMARRQQRLWQHFNAF